MRKLLLMLALAIPMMGYCGFIDWITGYPKVKAKIEKQLEQKYQGDKFEVLDLEYSNNLKGYNFKAKDISKDLTAEGSYFPKTGIIWGNGFKKQMMQKYLEEMIKPYILEVSKNYYFSGFISYVIPSPMTKYRSSMIDKVLGYQYDQGVDLKKWIAKYHQEGVLSFDIKIQSKRDPQSIYKVIKMTYEINKYLQSLKMGEYGFSISTFDVPNGFNINKWYKVKKAAHSSSVNPDKDLYKYAWGYFGVSSCPSNGKWGKACETEPHKDARGYTIKDTNGNKLFPAKRLADHIHSIQDIAKYFEMYNYGKPDVETWETHGMKYSEKHTYYKWKAIYGRSVTPLDKTKYYPAVEKLILENKK
ncbi:hypothetical protein [Francisella sp. SYW-9]|uniref:hypothetical protein n=1 Tax=Francisella sp. SYW-9 TaxID=2610888 RepID=UPI00123E04F7|nr:hypothetical protein [Francisella sp. SYW-9]